MFLEREREREEGEEKEDDPERVCHSAMRALTCRTRRVDPDTRKIPGVRRPSNEVEGGGGGGVFITQQKKGSSRNSTPGLESNGMLPHSNTHTPCSRINWIATSAITGRRRLGFFKRIRSSSRT